MHIVMGPARAWFGRVRRWFAQRLARCSHEPYFLLLGAAVAAVAAATILAGHWSAFERKSFDLFMHARLSAPAPHPDIVIADIDEHSLAAMAADYGRWPWPRRVLGEFIEAVEAQQPRAIVLDILFADPDLHNPDSEAAFDAAVRHSPHVFYTAARLPPQFDAASGLTVDRVPGALPPLAAPAATPPKVAMILPYLDSILSGGRIGTTNLLPDRDGVAREALLHHDVGGWRIPSLPAAVAAGLGVGLPAGDRIMLNWRGAAGSYPHVSFSDVYLDTLRRTPTRPADEFRGKIVFVGSSAAGLFDLRPTPVSQVHPGTEILATALDNLMRGDFIRRAPAWLVALLTAGFVMTLAWMFAFHRDNRLSDGAFIVVQVLVGILAFAVIHVVPVYIDATAAITFGTAFFAFARISLASRDRSRAGLLREKLGTSPLTAHILWVRCPLPKRQAAVMQRLLARAARRSCLIVAQLTPPTDSLGLLNRAFGGESGLAWLVPTTGEDDQCARSEIDDVVLRLDAWAAANAVSLCHRITSATIPSDMHASSDLRHVLANLLTAPADQYREASNGNDQDI